MADKNHRINFDINAQDRTKVAFAAVKKSMGDVQDASEKLSGAFSSIGLGFAVAGVTAAFQGASIKGILDYRAALDDLGSVTGDRIQTLDGLARVARVSGVELDALGGLLGKLATNLGDSGEEGKAASGAIKAIGLSVEQLRSLKPGEAFFEIAKALGEYEDGADKARVAQALLGKEGARALPFLKDLAEQQALQGKLTAEQVADAGKLEKEFRRLAIAWEDGKQALATSLIPEISKLVEQMRVGIQIAGSFGEAVRLFGLGISPIGSPAEKIRELNDELTKIGDKRKDVYGFIREESFAAAEADIKKKIRFLQLMQQQDALANAGPGDLDARDLKARQGKKLDAKNLTTGGAGSKEDPFGDIMKRIAAAESALVSEGNFYTEIATQLKNDKKLSAELSEEQKKIVLQAAARVAQEKDLIELRKEMQKYEEESLRVESARVKALGQEAEVIKDQLDPTRALFRELDRIDKLRAGNFLGQADAAEASRLAVERVVQAAQNQQVLTAAVDDTKNAWADLGFTASSALEDLIVRGGKLSDVLKAAGQDFARIMFRKNIGDPLAKASEGFFGNLFGNKSNTTTNAKFLEALDLQGFATGGAFTVRGAGGTDSQVVAFRATPGEEVSIRTPGQQAQRGGGGPVFNVDMRGASVEAVARLERFVSQINGSIESRAVGAMLGARSRGMA